MAGNNVAERLENGERLTFNQIYKESENAAAWVLRKGRYQNGQIILSIDDVQKDVDNGAGIAATSTGIKSKPDREMARKKVEKKIEDNPNQAIFDTINEYVSPSNYDAKNILKKGGLIGLAGIAVAGVSYLAGGLLPEIISTMMRLIGILVAFALPSSILLALATKFGGNEVRLIKKLGAADIALDRIGGTIVTAGKTDDLAKNNF